MVEKKLDDKGVSCKNQETPAEMAKRICSYDFYWHKWDLLGIELTQPEIYPEVLAEYQRLQAKECEDDESQSDSRTCVIRDHDEGA